MNDVKEKFAALKKAFDDLNQGPFTYYIDTLLSHSDALFNKYAPFKVGEKVRLKKGIDCNNGWKNSEPDLRGGALATVHRVEYFSDAFRFSVILDVETYEHYPSKQRVRVEDDRKHLFCISEKFLEKPYATSTSSSNVTAKESDPLECIGKGFDVDEYYEESTPKVLEINTVLPLLVKAVAGSPSEKESAVLKLKELS